MFVQNSKWNIRNFIIFLSNENLICTFGIVSIREILFSFYKIEPIRRSFGSQKFSYTRRVWSLCKYREKIFSSRSSRLSRGITCSKYQNWIIPTSSIPLPASHTPPLFRENTYGVFCFAFKPYKTFQGCPLVNSCVKTCTVSIIVYKVGRERVCLYLVIRLDR